MAMNLAICQVFIANLANNTALIGVYQGSYGIGGITGPLIATALVSKGNIWSRFYAIELGLAALNLAASGWAFWDSERESISSIPPSAVDHNLQGNSSHNVRNMTDFVERKWRSFKNLLSNRPTVFGALFMFSYQGAEVAISGWVISFLVQFRHGDPSKVGYVTSGFWAGITLGLYSSQDSQVGH
jgi:fucose permease